MFLFLLFAEDNKDLQIALAGDALTRGDFALAKDIYLKAYEQSKEAIYAREVAIAYAAMGDLSLALQYALLYQNATKDTKDLPTSKIIADGYIRRGEIQKAIVLLEGIRKEESSPAIDHILGTLYLNQKQFDKALGLLNAYYEYSQDEEALKKILAIYFSQNKNDKAIVQLEEYLNKKMCSQDLCQKAIDIFNQFGRNDAAHKIFAKYYKESPTLQNAKYYLQVLLNQKQFDEAEKIAKSFPFDRRLLLDLYVVQNKFKEASFQAKKIYEEKKEAKFLAWSAIYAYQGEQNISALELKQIIANLTEAIDARAKQRKIDNENPNSEDAFFYNFLGYVLVEHDIDIKKGIDLIKQALKISPNSLAYIDSLAWGYYKLGDCLQAQNIFSNIPKDQIKEDAELRSHFEAIRQCH